MKVSSVEKVIYFDNGDSFKIGEVVKIKGYNDIEVIAEIDGISEIVGGQGTLSLCNKKGFFCIEVKDIEHLEHI